MLLSRIFLITGSVICPENTSIISKASWSSHSWRFVRSFSMYGMTIWSRMIQVYCWSALHLRFTNMNQEISLVGYFFRSRPFKSVCIDRNWFSHVMPNVAVIACLIELPVIAAYFDPCAYNVRLVTRAYFRGFWSKLRISDGGIEYSST